MGRSKKLTTRAGVTPAHSFLKFEDSQVPLPYDEPLGAIVAANERQGGSEHGSVAIIDGEPNNATDAILASLGDSLFEFARLEEENLESVGVGKEQLPTVRDAALLHVRLFRSC